MFLRSSAEWQNVGSTALAEDVKAPLQQLFSQAKYPLDSQTQTSPQDRHVIGFVYGRPSWMLLWRVQIQLSWVLNGFHYLARPVRNCNTFVWQDNGTEARSLDKAEWRSPVKRKSPFLKGVCSCHTKCFFFLLRFWPPLQSWNARWRDFGRELTQHWAGSPQSRDAAFTLAAKFSLTAVEMYWNTWKRLPQWHYAIHSCNLHIIADRVGPRWWSRNTLLLQEHTTACVLCTPNLLCCMAPKRAQVPAFARQNLAKDTWFEKWHIMYKSIHLTPLLKNITLAGGGKGGQTS